MKIYIHTDLEGISGIDSMEMINRDGPQWRHSIERLMADVNAAVRGAFAGGATQVTVSDNHGGGGNFDLSLLDSRADFDEKGTPHQAWGKLDESYDASFVIGQHAMAGTINGFLDHTINSSKWFNYWVNGRRMGELGIWGMVTGYYNIPVIMVSGDQAACVEAREIFTPVETAEVKKGIGRNKAKLLDPDKAVKLIEEKAEKAIALIGTAKPFNPLLPLELKLELYRSDYCDEMANFPEVERIDARTIRKVSNSLLNCRFKFNDWGN